LNDDIANQMYVNNQSINIYKESDPITRKHMITFGGTCYLAAHKLPKLPDSFAFNEIIKEIGAQRFLDLTDKFIEIPENFINDIIETTSWLGTDELTRKVGYCKNIW
jgi:hypothetical protein